MICWFALPLICYSFVSFVPSFVLFVQPLFLISLPECGAGRLEPNNKPGIRN